MIKEIQEISNKLAELSSLVDKKILSAEDLFILENAKKAMFSIKKDIDLLLHNASLLPLEDIDSFTTILTKISHLLSLQAIAINEIYAVSVKFIQNHRKKWKSATETIA
jgi:hypothetical protein